MNDIRNLTFEELKTFITVFGEKEYRAKQIYGWLWKHFVPSFDEMKNLPSSLINKLNEKFELTSLMPLKKAESSDGTEKVLFELHDGHQIEAVLIPDRKRITVCISTQAGCPVNCSFCATAQLGFKRNLTTAEIYAQVSYMQKLSLEKHKKTISNIVIMGMGEPLLNYDNVLRFCTIINSEDGLSFPASKITLSTVGIPKLIKKMADDNFKCRLAVSLHATTDKDRSKIIPVSKTYTIEDLIISLDYYYKKTQKDITIEYILLKDFNDSEEDARRLAKIVRRMPSKVNIISFNSFENALFEKSDINKSQKFIKLLELKGVNVRLRKSRGDNIKAACGQLANSLK